MDRDVVVDWSLERVGRDAMAWVEEVLGDGAVAPWVWPRYVPETFSGEFFFVPHLQIWAPGDRSGLFLLEQRASDGRLYLHTAFRSGRRGRALLGFAPTLEAIGLGLGYRELFTEVADDPAFLHVRVLTRKVGFLPVGRRVAEHELVMRPGPVELIVYQRRLEGR